MSRSAAELYGAISDKLGSAPLSQTLPHVLILARRLKHLELEKWVRLEMNGYLRGNPAMTEDVTVPEYRTVAGQRSDEFGRPLIISDPQLQFISEERVRMGVQELEHLARGTNMLTIRTPASDLTS
jgi:hypothetical protein